MGLGLTPEGRLAVGSPGGAFSFERGTCVLQSNRLLSCCRFEVGLGLTPEGSRPRSTEDDEEGEERYLQTPDLIL